MNLVLTMKLATSILDWLKVISSLQIYVSTVEDNNSKKLRDQAWLGIP